MKLNNKQFIFALLYTLVLPLASSYQLYCKCECNVKTIINPIDKCKLCTEEYCLSKDKDLCASTEEDPDKSSAIIISCFQIESFKESFVIYSFISIVVGLMFYIGYHSYMRQ
ncbi:hypothetical protein MG5_02263 [Candida albicans P57072]|nr:hypothetical protein MEO_02263 [Candida albicans P94015]KGQ95866.1 hypothetical protein MEU_02267 [Candida albicans P37005]KGR00465.1 hypothetical protein MG1_02293 [Candida albicans GC75]KGR11716.1 hypothetical protein MG5_02263 [Candida albicans P57072]KGU11168.1 hypothetical protein MEQ_02247 [Candida albicans P87]KGU28929.1 hypothetical protein MG7_02280 [Candida albicans P34048]KGU32951.1 putative adhesin-like protein [Candida albicans P75063]KGU35449.1 putative adhesin-like protein 